MPTTRNERSPSLPPWLVLVNRLRETIEERSARYGKFMLVVILAISTALSFQGFFLGPLSNVDFDMDVAKWVYLALGIGVALSIALYERFRRAQTYVFALSTVAFGATFIALGYQPKVGTMIVVLTPVVVTLIAVVEWLDERLVGKRRGSAG